MPMFNASFSRRHIIQSISALGVTTIFSNPSLAFGGNNTDIEKAGINLTGRLLPDKMMEMISSSKEAAIQEKMMAAISSLSAGGDEALQHILEQWAFFYTGDKYHILKCPTCHYIASRALEGVTVGDRRLVNYVPELQVPDCFTMYVEAEKHHVTRRNAFELHLVEGGAANTQYPVAALIFYHSHYWAAGTRSAYLGPNLPPLALLQEVACISQS